MRLSRFRRAAVTTIVILGASASTAWAQDLDVQVDPDSPAGQEYALPVDQANRVAGTPSGSAAGDAGAKPLFGEGVKPARARAATRPEAPASPETSSADDGGTPRSSVTRAAEPSGSALPWLLGSGAVVVLIGVGLSRALRRVARAA
jgi:hypothetical protein